MSDREDQTEGLAEKTEAVAATSVNDSPAQAEMSESAPVEGAPVEVGQPETAASVDTTVSKAEPPRAAQKASPKPKAKPAGKAAKAKAVKRTSAAPAKAELQDSLPQPTITELKEKIMDTRQGPDYSKLVSEAMNEMQSRAKTAYEKSTEVAGEITELARGNAEAVAESGKVLASGVQELGKTYVEEAKTAYEMITTDLKEMAAVKSPTELFQLQSRLVRRNFDALVAYNSKNSEAMLKLANEAFAPISGRLNVAADRMAKIA